jgi:hypothetical protein
VIDTGAPLIVLRLSRGSAGQVGVPEDTSDIAPTAVKLADLASNPAPARAKPVAKAKAKAKPKAARKAATKPAKKAVKRPARHSPRWPQNRPPLFTVPGARKEPLDEMPLTARAKLLLAWLQTSPRPSDANVQRWLYQHAWIVAGARMGWWQGDDALRTLIAADNKVWALWGIGARSEAIARTTLAQVDARAK